MLHFCYKLFVTECLIQIVNELACAAYGTEKELYEKLRTIAKKNKESVFDKFKKAFK